MRDRYFRSYTQFKEYPKMDVERGKYDLLDVFKRAT